MEMESQPRTLGPANDQVSAPIWAGLTEKQERFAHLVADGLNFSAAYREVYDASGMSQPSVWREAHRLSRKEKVAMRIAELVAARQEEERLQAHMRAYRVTAHLEKMMTSGASETTRLRAAELLGKTVGLFVEKPPAKDDDRSLAELEAELAERMAKLKLVGAVKGCRED
ncbi:terminase small subunit [Ovoidimarina sediminis]|uniref:terminase small subunit n=1 Tax=Ovoidimarina sediminis TaxID=3079856 RepID=UPI0029069527|nr:terminase small subunit [Rhodophyticola sp. MJ-SS7]MDU8943492.1 terminase small subunit [Rhodophyticola sp. MJ-SS7]